MRLMIAIALMILLSACGVAGRPNQGLVEKAIDLQLRQAQATLSQQLNHAPAADPNVRISHVRIKHQEPLTIEDLQAYRVQGTYDLTQKYADRQITQNNNPFELYLQRQVEGKTWRLARLELKQGEPSWITQLIQ
jgi:hypothetical protein